MTSLQVKSTRSSKADKLLLLKQIEDLYGDNQESKLTALFRMWLQGEQTMETDHREAIEQKMKTAAEKAGEYDIATLANYKVNFVSYEHEYSSRETIIVAMIESRNGNKRKNILDQDQALLDLAAILVEEEGIDLSRFDSMYGSLTKSFVDDEEAEWLTNHVREHASHLRRLHTAIAHLRTVLFEIHTPTWSIYTVLGMLEAELKESTPDANNLMGYRSLAMRCGLKREDQLSAWSDAKQAVADAEDQLRALTTQWKKKFQVEATTY